MTCVCVCDDDDDDDENAHAHTHTLSLFLSLSLSLSLSHTGKRQSPINIITSKASVNPSLSLSAVMFADVGQLLVNDFRNLATGTHNGHAVGLSGN